MGCYAMIIDRGNNDHGVADTLRVPAIASDDAKNTQTPRFGQIEGMNDIRADVLLEIATADRENEHRIPFGGSAALQPRLEHAFPPFVVGSRGQLGNIVRRGVGFDPAELAEIVDRMSGVAPHARATPQALDKDYRSLCDR